MLPEAVGTDDCLLANRWILDPVVAKMIVGLDSWARVEMEKVNLPWPGLWIISGHRSQALQEEVNPEAPNSMHTRCPSLAVDLRVGNVSASITTAAIWSWLGAQWIVMGGRWGGMFNPPDFNHFDFPIFPM